MRKYFLIFLLLTPYLTYTQGSSKGVSSLKLPLTPIVAGSGESFIAYPTNIQSIRINPANVASLESYGLLFSHSEWILDTQTEYLSVVAPFQYGSLAFSISSTNVNNIEIRDIPGEPIGTFDFSSSAFQLNYGVEINNFLKIGIASKYIYEKNYIDESSGFGFDAGLLYYTPINNLIVGFSITDIGSMSAFRNEEVDLTTKLRLGSTFSYCVENFIIKIATAYSSEVGTSNQHLHIGTEATYNELLSFRIGYQTGYEIRNISGGIGIAYNIISLDYAYIPTTKQTGDSHIMSIGFNF